MTESENLDRHESYGVVQFNRIQGDSGNLFGSSIRHQNFVRLRVCRAHRKRDLHTHWYRDDEEIVEVDLSPTQFSDLLTNMNCGVGIPCTIRYVDRKRMANCPSVEQRATFEAEFDADVRKVMKDANDLAARVEAMLGQKSVKKSELQEVSGMLRMLMQHINSNMPFVQSQFNEAMDKTVTEAKGEVDAFVQHRIVSLGIEALREMVGDSPGGMLGEAADAKRIESKAK